MASKKFRLQITMDECKGCLRCVPACPKKLIVKGTEINKQGYIAVEATDALACIGCGSCFHQCPEPGAITIYEVED